MKPDFTLNSPLKIFSLFLLFSISLKGQTLEDFNHGKQVISESNCWVFDNITVEKPHPSVAINAGIDRPLALADLVDGGSGIRSFLYSPYVYLDGSGNISFSHNMQTDAWAGYNSVEIYLEGLDGTVISLGLHEYQVFGSYPNGNPAIPVNTSYPVGVSGYYRVVWEWTGWLSESPAQIDDISIPNDTMPFIENYTACEGDLGVVYEPTQSETLTNFNYTWTQTAGPAVTLTTQTSNNRQLSVDYTTSGSYQFHCQESYTTSAGNTCDGRETIINVTVAPAPIVKGDFVGNVCPGEKPTVEFRFSGKAPYTIEYRTDGGTLQSFTTSSNPATLTLPENTNTFEIVDYFDVLAGCSGIIAGASVINASYYPTPSTGAIYH